MSPKPVKNMKKEQERKAMMSPNVSAFSAMSAIPYNDENEEFDEEIGSSPFVYNEYAGIKKHKAGMPEFLSQGNNDD
jgi:hypothetical protein